ncbi:MAG: hypothetical protein EA409_05520 [Saprospirales bacterium]|nr:MAG: hypothetical protein EA409_05520 [Saprospirales bacterium]
MGMGYSGWKRCTHDPGWFQRGVNMLRISTQDGVSMVRIFDQRFCICRIGSKIPCEKRQDLGWQLATLNPA